MPSVASEVQNVLTARANLPSSRSQADADARQASTPFADMLDSATAAAEPAPKPAPRPQRTDAPARSDDSKPASNASAPATDQANADSSAAAPTQGDPADAPGVTNAAPNIDAAVAAPAPSGTSDAKPEADKPTADTDKTGADADKTKPDTDPSATVAAIVAAVPQPAATNAPQPAGAPLIPLPVQPADTPKAETPEIKPDALAALQANGPRAGTAKPVAQGRTQGSDQGNVPDAASGNAPAKAAPDTDPQTVQQVDGGGDKPQPRGNGEAGEPRRSFADLLGKPDANPAAQTPSDAAGAAKSATDAMQNIGAITQTAPTGATAAPTATSTLAQPQSVAVPLSGLAVEIATQARNGNNRFEIRLDPPELGRIDVKLNVDRNGNVSTHLTADRADTLDLLKRDQASLERALQDSGLKTSDNALQFSLRQQQDFGRDDAPSQNTTQLNVPDDDPAPLEALRQGYGRLLGLGGGLDIRV